MLLRKFHRAQITVLFFEIGKEPLHAVFFRGACTDLVEPRGIFVRTDGKGGTKPRKALLFRGAGGAVQAEFITFVTARAALALPFQAPRRGKKFGGFVIAVEQIRPARFAQQAYLLPFSLFILGGVGYIRIIIEYGDGKGIFEQLQTARGAGAAATVQQQRRALGDTLHDLQHLFVAIDPVHGGIVAQTGKKRNRTGGKTRLTPTFQPFDKIRQTKPKSNKISGGNAEKNTLRKKN